ncbi:heterokaryon incompatibility protein-domain-containing protein, partial [Lasiosphaeris hirsuta]
SGSDEVVARARTWLEFCVNNHRQCHRPPSQLPKRILDLGHGTRPLNVKLHETRGEVEKYAALSYPWGTEVPLKTLATNLDSHLKGIQIETFSRTLRQSIMFARRLGFRYLWIDALYIIQDDADDWAEQAAQMASIFSSASITISA